MDEFDTQIKAMRDAARKERIGMELRNEIRKRGGGNMPPEMVNATLAMALAALIKVDEADA